MSAALRSATGGNPLFVAELAHRLHREGRLDRVTPGEELPVPPGVRVVLGLKLQDLDDACRRALAVAAVAGLVFSVDVVASVLGQDRVELLGIVDQAVRAGVIVPAGGSRFAWSHPLLRAVVYEDIGVAARVRLHARVGDALEAALASGHDVELAAVSFHYLKAAAGGTAAKAVSYAERAAQEAMAALGYEEAARLYDRALEACRLDPAVADRGRLLLGAGAARAAAGDTAGARQAFLGAAEHARRTRRAVQLANAALGLSGAGFEVALFDVEQRRLLEEALGALGDREPALRSRLSARLAVALSLAGEDARRVELSESAVNLAVQAGDDAARSAALAARCDARAGPEDIDRRTGDATEIVRAARAAAEPGLELTGRRLRIVALAEAGDMPGFDAEVREFAQVADRLGQARYRWYVPLWKAARAASRGRLGEQGVLLAEAAALGRAAQSANSGILVLVQRWFAWLEAGDLETAAAIGRQRPATSAPLSAATLARIRATLRAALNAAIREGLISANPAKLVELPPPARPHPVVWTVPREAAWRESGVRPAVAVWTAEQTARFLAAIRDEPLYPCYHLMAVSGLRRGEAAGLRWCDIDFTAATLTVSRQLQENGRGLVVLPPKSIASNRVLALDPWTVQVLAAHRYRQLSAPGDGYVFARPGGRPYTPGYLTRTFIRLIRRAGLPPIRLHDLRHGAATLALAGGADLKAIQDMLGHASIILTADTYTSVLPDLARTTAKAVAAQIIKAARTPPGLITAPPWPHTPAA